MTSVYVHSEGTTRVVERVEPQWLDPGSQVMLWVDLAGASLDEKRALLADTFRFHPLAVEDALAEAHHPKSESYDGYLYVILHRIAFQQKEHRFTTSDVDFFLGRNYLVSIHDGASRSIAEMRDLCDRHEHILASGPQALLYRIVDAMVDNYRPEVDALEQRVDKLERDAVLGTRESMVRQLLAVKRDLASLRRVVTAQRDAVARLARREFAQISDEMAYRFRDVYDHLVRLADESIQFQDRVTSILDAHLSVVSNRLNQIVKVLTVMSTIFLPLTVLTGLYGMNVELPHLPGGEPAQFWWVVGVMAAIAAGMLVLFRIKRWI